MADSSSQPRLHALGGAHPPDELAGDLRQLSALPEAARAHIWQLVEANLGRDVAEQHGELARHFGQRFGVPREQLVRLVRGARLLLRSAAMRDVPVEQVTMDLNVLCGEHPEVVRTFTGWYARALPSVRSREVIDKLPEFGAVLTDVHVRRGFIPTSRHTPNVVTPLSTMTLCYHEHGQDKRVTLQLTHQALALLRARCEELA